MENSKLYDKSLLDAHVRNCLKGFEPFISHDEIPNRILNQILPLDFEGKVYEFKEELEYDTATKLQKAEIEKQLANVRPKLHHYLVLIIEEIIRLMEDNKYGIRKHQNEIYIYNGAYWKTIDRESFQKFLGDAAINMGVIRCKAKFYQFKENLFKQFLSDAYVQAPLPDKNLVQINLLNGTFTISLNERTLEYFRAEDFLTYQLQFEFDSKANAPRFQEYLDRVLPDKSQQLVLAEYIGFLFVKNGSKAIKEEKALILYGTGANGKSVFFEIINALLGNENVANYALQNLTNENGYYRAKLANKLLNYASELSGKMETYIFKQMVSGEPVDARLPYGEPFSLTQYAKMIFNCNELPKDVEHTNAYFRRFLIIHFAQTIPQEEQDKQLHNKIIDTELAGVFNWALEGLSRLLLNKGFTYSEAIEKSRDEYKMQSDSILLFLQEENFQPSTTNSLTLKELYSQYSIFCYENGFKSCGNTSFSKRLSGASYTIERKAAGRIVYIQKINI